MVFGTIVGSLLAILVLAAGTVYQSSAMLRIAVPGFLGIKTHQEFTDNSACYSIPSTCHALSRGSAKKLIRVMFTGAEACES